MTAAPSPSSFLPAPSLRDASPEVAHAYLIAQEARLNTALQQAARSRAASSRMSGPTVSRLVQAAAGHPGAGTPNPVAQAMVARALDASYQADVQAVGLGGGDRLVAEMELKSALGRARGETLTSLAFLGHHPLLREPSLPSSTWTDHPALRRHAMNVASSLRHLTAVRERLRASGDPAIQARAHRADDALTHLREHPRWGAVVRLAETLVSEADPEPEAVASAPTPDRRARVR